MEALLAEGGTQLLESAALQGVGESIRSAVQDGSGPQPGTEFGPYEILGRLGGGGMGDVYRARDKRLQRTVAIKFVRSGFSERFQREARAVAALNHPFICHLYDVGPDYLVMEYVEGAPLKGPLPVDEALRLGIQIAEALDVIHRKGIVHRDLKPANILVTKAGVKLLDFGIAKFQGAMTSDQTVTMSTAQGQIVGTLNYMSPEQIQGQEADTRSDVFSFGLVLYEMLTGKRAFRAENTASVIAAILKEKPEPIAKTMPLTPPALDRLLSRALEKDPERRWQNVRDMMLEMQSFLEMPTEAALAPTIVASRISLKTAGVAVFLTLIACGLVAPLLQDRPDTTIGKMSLVPLAVEPEIEVDPIFSPDGKSLVYSRGIRGTRQLFVRSFNAQGATQLTECSTSCDPIAWSPDGARIFFAEGTDLQVTSSSGGTPSVVLKSVNHTTSFVKPITLSPDAKALVFARLRPGGGAELVVSSPPGADPKPLQDFVPSSASIYSVRFSPDGRKLLVSPSGIPKIVIVPFPRGKPYELELSSSSVNWMPDSRHIVYATPFLSSLEEVVLQDTETRAAQTILRSENPVFEMNVSPDATRMAYHSGNPSLGIMELAIDSGTLHPLRMTRLNERDASYSPAGDRYIYVSAANGVGEITVREMSGSGATQLTFGHPAVDRGKLPMAQPAGGPVFSPNGRRIAFSMNGQIWTMPSTGGQPAPLTPAGTDPVTAPAWSPDGRWIAYQRGAQGNRELVKIDSVGPGQTVVLSPKPASGTVSVFTRWSSTSHIAYLGKDGVRICREDGTGDRLLIAKSMARGLEGSGPHESISGDFNRRGDLFYALKRESGKWMVLTVEVSSGRVLRTVATEESPDAGVRSAWLHPDGKRMVYSRSELNYDICVLEGLPRPETGLMRLFRHWKP